MSRLITIFDTIITPAEAVLQDIEEYGAYVDYDELIKLTLDYQIKRDEALKDLDDMLPATMRGEINWNSPNQVRELLFDRLKLPIISRTEKGVPQTGKSVLLRLVDQHPIPGKLLEARKYSKALNGFLNPWKEYLDYEISMGRPPRLHTTYNIAKTNTGRLSAEDPNLQQVPRLTGIRSLICAPPGYVIIEADYSQIELRIAAFIARAYSMLSIYNTGGDLHLKTAMATSGLKAEEITKELRTRAKAVNFGYIYGMWWKSFKAYAFDNYGVTLTDREAEQSRNDFFKSYPELTHWHERSKKYVHTYKYIKSPLGRIRYLPNIDSFDKELRGKAERQAINTPVQSTASDMLLIALIHVHHMLREKNYDAHLIGEVHDSILIECRSDQAKEVGTLVKRCMEETVPLVLRKVFSVTLDVPIVADVTIGPGWGQGVDLSEV